MLIECLLLAVLLTLRSVTRHERGLEIKVNKASAQVADAAKVSLVWLNLGCSPDFLLLSLVLQAKRLMEEVVKLEEAVAAAMRVVAALLMEASENNAGEEERKPPGEWMADDASLSARLKHV